MNTSVRIAAALALAIAGQALALSNVTYTVELSADPYGPNATQWEAGSFPVYSPDPAGGTTREWTQGTKLNWAVKVTTSGIHSSPVEWGLGDQAEPVGLANVVFDLEIKDSTATRVPVPHAAMAFDTASPPTNGHPTRGGWYSVINDGDQDGARGLIDGPDPDQNAAFAMVFDVSGNGYKGGRVYDPKTQGGPNMNAAGGVTPQGWPSAWGDTVANKPTAADFAGTDPNGRSRTLDQGLLLGMGAGFACPWNYTTMVAGVGLETDTGCGYLGEKVLFEGQIDTRDLEPGTYTLIVNGADPSDPATKGGTNIIAYTDDVCSLVLDTAFAVAPNEVTDGSVQFVITSACEDLAFHATQNAVSRKRHGTFGLYDQAAGTWEGRYTTTANMGPTTVVTWFNQAIQRVNGDNTDISVSSGTIGTITIGTSPDDNMLTVTLSSVTDQANFTISYPGIAAACDINKRLPTGSSKCWSVLAGEVNGLIVSGPKRQVNSADMLAIRTPLLKYVNQGATYYRSDLNMGGRVDSADMLNCRSKLLKTCPTCP